MSERIPKAPRAVPADQVRTARGQKIVPVPLEKARSARGIKIVPVPRSKVAATRAFRRMRSDRLAGLVGVALVIIAALLLFTWPQPTPKKPPTFTIEWPEADTAAFQQNVSLGRTGEFNQDIPLSASNITRILLYINWRDDVGDDAWEKDNLAVSLVGPGPNMTISFNSTAGPEFVNATHPKTVGKKPDLREVVAKTEPEARSKIGDLSTRNGTGTWRLSLRLTFVGDDYHGDAGNVSRNQQCPPQTPPQGTALCTPDSGNVVEVRVSYRSYSLALRPPST